MCFTTNQECSNIWNLQNEISLWMYWGNSPVNVVYKISNVLHHWNNDKPNDEYQYNKD